MNYKIIDGFIGRINTNKSLIFLPYLSGERSPFHDEAARGMIFGLASDTKNEDILKSIFEGVAFAFQHNIITLGIKNLQNIPITGGISRFNSFCQILANITGITISKLDEDFSNPVFGTAVLASRSLNLISRRNIASYVKIEKKYYPERSETEFYSHLFNIYKALYPCLKEEYRKLSDIERRSSTHT